VNLVMRAVDPVDPAYALHHCLDVGGDADQAQRGRALQVYALRHGVAHEDGAAPFPAAAQAPEIHQRLRLRAGAQAAEARRHVAEQRAVQLRLRRADDGKDLRVLAGSALEHLGIEMEDAEPFGEKDRPSVAAQDTLHRLDASDVERGELGRVEQRLDPVADGRRVEPLDPEPELAGPVIPQRRGHAELRASHPRADVAGPFPAREGDRDADM
jgi:hypothetical protein